MKTPFRSYPTHIYVAVSSQNGTGSKVCSTAIASSRLGAQASRAYRMILKCLVSDPNFAVVIRHDPQVARRLLVLKALEEVY